MHKIFMDICMDLWAGDVAITYKIFKQEINNRIENLSSTIGEAAHRHLLEIGVTDETGMTWEEQDMYTKNQIDKLQQLLNYLETDSNWTL